MAVGVGAPNQFDDVKAIQIALNLNRVRAGFAPALDEDGKWGSQTLEAIAAFQRAVMGISKPDVQLLPSCNTIVELRRGLPPGLSESKLKGTMPKAAGEDLARFFPKMATTLRAYAIDTPIRHAHFLAQIGHESAALGCTEELATGDAYEHRIDLGNTHPGDGRKFKGRGLIQLTGRANYEKYGRAKGIDFTTDANCRLLATDPQLALDVACWFWKTHGLNELADKDDILALTRRINGGLAGLADRESYLLRSKFFLLPAADVQV